MDIEELINKALAGTFISSHSRKVLDVRYGEWQRRRIIKDIPDNIDKLIQECNKLNNEFLIGKYKVYTSPYQVNVITGINIGIVKHNNDDILIVDIKGNSLMM